MISRTHVATIRQHYLTAFKSPAKGERFSYYQLPIRKPSERVFWAARRALIWMGKFCVALACFKAALSGADAVKVTRDGRRLFSAVTWMGLSSASAFCSLGMSLADTQLTAKCKRTKMLKGLAVEGLLSGTSVITRLKYPPPECIRQWVRCVRYASIAAGIGNLYRLAVLVEDEV